jgi:hypothetical protein
VRGRAIQIHDELVYADAAAFFGMNAMWDTTSHAQHYQVLLQMFGAEPLSVSGEYRLSA